MSLQDRDYYRDEEPNSWGEWLDSRGAATVIAITGAIFLLQIFSTPRVGPLPRISAQEFRDNYSDFREKSFDGVRKFGDLYLPAVLSGEVWRLATAFWVHDVGNLFGVIFGMLIVYFTGKLLEQIMGGKEFFAFYWYSGFFVMLCLFLGKLLEKFLFAGKPVWPFDSAIGVCGSAGPVTAVLVLFALKYRDQPVQFMFALTMPAWGAVVLIVGISILFSLGNMDRGESVSSILLGILAAWTYQRLGIRIMDRIPRFGKTTSHSQQRLSRLRLVPSPENENTDDDSEVDERLSRRQDHRKVAVQTGAVVDEQLEAKLDRVLDKVAKSGTESLSADERSILLKASEVYKRRRGGS